MKHIAITLLLVALFAALLAGCGETKTLTCDGCGAEVTVEANSDMEESWIVYCGPCNEELFGDHSILGND